MSVILFLFTISTEAGAADRFCCNYFDAKFGSCCCRDGDGNKIEFLKKFHIIGYISEIFCSDYADCYYGWIC